MKLFKRNPFFCSLLLVMLAIGVTGVWYLSSLSQELGLLKVQYDAKVAQYSGHIGAKPSPTKANLNAIANNYAELYEVYDRAMRVLNLNTYDRDGMFDSAPESRADWSFEVHKYIDNVRYNALSNGVGFPSDTSFGLSKYSEESPAVEDMELVHRQVTIMTNLLQSLFGSGINSFVSIERGVPLISKQAKGTSKSARRNSGIALNADEFLVSDSMSMAVPGIFDAYAFRVTFNGQSIALRSFLNGIVNSPLPYAIRGIEVKLASESGLKSELETLADNPFALEDAEELSRSVSSVPIISNNSSQFIVTLEFLDLVAEIEEPRVASNRERAGDDV